MTKRNRSPQREAIWQAILNTTLHPTASQLLETLRNHSPSLSRANLYRNLKILLQEGRIQIRDMGDGLERYDAITTPHYHFVCKICGQITDFPLALQETITRLAKDASDHQVDGHKLQFFGVCKTCLKNQP